MIKTKTINVKEKEANQRMDVFLAARLDITRSQAQKMFREKRLLLNDIEPRKIGETIKTGDVIKIIAEKKSSSNKIVVRQQKLAVPKIKIIAETDDYIVIDKPCGLLTHGLPGKNEPSASSILAGKFPEIKNIGDNPAARAGIIHRLDREASGVLVVARTQKMFDHLKKQFKKRTVGKEYRALVHGRIASDQSFINFPIERSKTHGKMASVPATKKGEVITTGREALTEFDVERRFVDFTLVKVKIHTGRTHQIRAHFIAYNHPVVGDPLYFQKKQKRFWDKKLGRLFLHSTTLSFKDLKNKTQTFTSPLPKNLKSFLTEIK